MIEKLVRGPLARHGGLFAVVVAAGLWGLGGTVAGALFDAGADPLEVVAVRTWTSLAGLALLLAWRRRAARPAPPPARGAWVAIVGFGLSVAVANAGLFLAISRLPVAVALVLQNLAPAFVIAWSVLATRRPPAVRVVAGLVVALVCVAFVVELPTAPLHLIDLPGVAFGLITAAAVAAFSAFGGKAAAACGALTANTWAFAISGLLWAGYQVTQGVPALSNSPGLLLAAVGVGVLGTLVPFLLFSWGTARVGVTVAAVNISLEPLFGAVLAWSWLGQRLTFAQIAAGVILLVALIDLQRTRTDVTTSEAPVPPRRRARSAKRDLVSREAVEG
ncbi:DMT family transporter [Spongiactinospora sp. TRM90649]|uniref:EamA family transporter n=1 Tax=Spongiactinospora sp. TRM90649 TaxID=3031114 RepID=UPI0023F6833D|nr:DMT family transporter [Spongiactinospora sp. TRM90649]MDF5753257.1 DMT family transporter [Spongiactinospora sp. TRM90649]